MLELLVSYGLAFWQECGTNGCWRQPPLPYEQHFTDQTASIGLRYKDIEVRYHDLGVASIHGSFVADSDYDSKTHGFNCAMPHIFWGQRKCEVIGTTATQHSTGVTAAWSPTFHTGSIQVKPSIGVLIMRQRLWVNDPGQRTEQLNVNRVTPLAGLSLGTDKLKVEFTAYHRPRFRDSVAGGGSHWYRPGLLTVGVQGQF